MCGINGFYQFDRNKGKEELIGIVRGMNDQIVHRGPDAEGYYADTRVGLAMRRLSIIDIRAGDQPIVNEDRTLVIILNGEVYNYRSLRAELIARGHVFTTESDTEVVLHCYEEHGLECMTYLEGMFAFAIYNIVTGELFLARDKIGEKPLFYCANAERFAFASEMKSLVRAGLVAKKINHDAMIKYLQLTYIPAPMTIFDDVLKLMPATYMIVASDGTIRQRSYWTLPYDPKALITDYQICKSLLREAVFKSVEQRMVSDVPIGTFLSGGIDSSIITAVMSSISDTPVKTYTIGFKEKEFDESDRAQLVVDKYKTDHHLFIMDFDAALSELDVILDNMDEPFGDSSIIATYMVAKIARKDVKVVLTGDCGDELFAGYSKYLIGHYSQAYNRIPRPLRKAVLEPILRRIPDKSALTRKLNKVVANAQIPAVEQHINLMSLALKADELRLLLIEEEGILGSLDFARDIFNRFPGDTITKAQYTDLYVVLEGDMFPKVDRASMLASLETRTPLIDSKVVELAYRFPSKYKIDRDRQKIILKDTFSDMLPPQLLSATKRGFGVPIGNWFRNQLKQSLNNCFEEAFVQEQGLFDVNYLRSLVDEHIHSVKNRSFELWTLFVFQRWYQRNMQ